MQNIRILYISIAGNTRNFVTHLKQYATQQHQADANEPEIELTEISEQSDFAHETKDFFAFVPTYLDGGNGIDNGVKEMMTNTLGEYIDYGDNASHCLGIVGSGNKNFNEQYCLTARRYAKQFDVPFLADYELRGTDCDVVRIYETLKDNIK
ncbi:class Ib ribonucleoside-diphosphate reductase assembly flavoprotein NrdI [Apilactobacillus bombintestini]|uniref:Ribonucleotide reductase assembly protein NrdI n=1 Tax=Apilactobacillus bombintestini TaxID=2419772 RepID=A0A387AY61_9LACO|nr:class Ib ribonucleoside-diphosphate reductase assembly flavoprotein NrdI [Apilactobacillus bombintestini]AYF92000.1 ribonucleotide reductase assembly protein NrdI [Apilactobacillus bombintestini]